MQSNIEQFNYYVGYIFAVLHDEFPCRHHIDPLKLVGGEECPETHSNGIWTGRYKCDGEIKDLRKELDFVYETANWLYETGYLIGNVGVTHHGRNIFVTLSPKALEILKVVPVSIGSNSGNQSIGQALSDAVKSAAKAQVSDITSKALSYLFKAGLGCII